MVLIAGVIDSKSNFVEHPQVVAQRIEAVVTAVGDRERVVAGVDCGFGTFVGWEWVTEDVVWAKLKVVARRRRARVVARFRRSARAARAEGSAERCFVDVTRCGERGLAAARV